VCGHGASSKALRSFASGVADWKPVSGAQVLDHLVDR